MVFSKKNANFHPNPLKEDQPFYVFVDDFMFFPGTVVQPANSLR